MNTKKNLLIIIFCITIIASIYFLQKNTSPLVSSIATSTPVVTNQPGMSGSVTFVDKKIGFSIDYPEIFALDQEYTYQNLGPGKNIKGVKFTIPQAIAEGTNLSNDSYISVEYIPQSTTCTARLFLDQSVKNTNVKENDIEYSVASSTGAGAGNRYEEIVYAVSGSHPCIAVRYFIHYGVLENYPAGSVKEFNKIALIQALDNIRRTLKIGK